MDARGSRFSQGFTLIELMIVMVLIGIMIAIAVPSFGRFISNYRATAAINDFLQGITTTRTEALKRGRKVSMVPVGGSWTNGWTVFVDKNANGAYDAGTEELIYQHGPLPASITVSSPNPAYTTAFSNANYVVFDGTGYPRLTTGSVLQGGIVMVDTLGSTSITNRRTLCLATMGRPRIVKDTPSEQCLLTSQ